MAITVTDRAAAVRRLLEASLSGNADVIGELVTEDVSGWSPTLFVSSRQELLDAVSEREDAFSNVASVVDAVDVVGEKAIAEWHVAADHTGPLVLDEDLVVEPTGRRLHLAGATFAEFDGERIRAFRHYFDDLALLEQVLPED